MIKINYQFDFLENSNELLCLQLSGFAFISKQFFLCGSNYNFYLSNNTNFY